MDSRRKLVYVRITPITILEVLIFVVSDKITYDNSIQTTILITMYDEILKHLTVVRGKLVTKKQQHLETSRTVNSGSGLSLTYYFKWMDKYQGTLLRDSPSQDQDKKSRYRPMTIYPYQLVVKVEDPHKSDSLHTYFSTVG